jgi:hypothetical protein
LRKPPSKRSMSFNSLPNPMIRDMSIIAQLVIGLGLSSLSLRTNMRSHRESRMGSSSFGTAIRIALRPRTTDG